MTRYKIGYENQFTGKKDFVVLSKKEFDDFWPLLDTYRASEQVEIAKAGITARKSTIFYQEVDDVKAPVFDHTTANRDLSVRYFDWEPGEPQMFGEKWLVERRDPEKGVIPDFVKYKKLRDAFSTDGKIRWYGIEVNRLVERMKKTDCPDPRIGDYGRAIKRLTI